MKSSSLRGVIGGLNDEDITHDPEFQRGNIVTSFDAGGEREINGRIHAKAEDLADELIRKGAMEGGYYDLELRKGGKLMDSEILIG